MVRLNVNPPAVLLISLSKTSFFFIFESLLTLISPYKHSRVAYIVYLALVFSGSVVAFFLYRPKLSKALWASYFLFFLWGILGFCQVLWLGFDLSALYFFVLCFDAILWTGVVVSENGMEQFWEYYSKFILFFSLMNLFILFSTMLRTGSLREIGTGNYQSYSYDCAYCFGMLGFYYLFDKYFVSKHKYAWLLLPVLFIATIFPGGRGGFVLLCLYFLFFVFYIVFRKRVRLTAMSPIQIGLIIFFIIIGIVVLIVYFDTVKGFLQSGITRALEFIDFSNMTINMAGTSGRDLVYSNAIKIIREHPIFGIGIYGYNYDSVWPQYPHNIILELLMQYGIPLGVVLVILLAYVEISLVLSKEYLMKGLSFFPVVNLMFSGSYTSNVLFWFVVMWFIASKVKTRTRKLSKNYEN